MAALVVCGVAAGYLAGSARSSSDVDEPGRATATPAPEEPAPRRVEPILDWFLNAKQKNLPVQGILGGTAETSALSFPRSFERRPGQVFYVEITDGHFLLSYRYRVRGPQRWTIARHFQRPLSERWPKETHLWRREPEQFVPAE